MAEETKVALITGAGGGIGRAIAARMAQDGFALVLTDNSAAAIAEGSAALDPALVHQLPGDLADPEFCERLVPAAIESAGRLDLLVNNAGLMRRGNVLAATDEDFSLSFTVNVEAPFRLCRSAIAYMRGHGGGAIVNVASCWGVHPGPDHVVYCMSKAALASLTQCLGRDHARDGVRVNAVCPNEVNTPMLRTGFALRGFDPAHAVAALNDSVPLGRIAEPDDIAAVVSFLASADARYLCGSLIEVNGGKPVY